MNMIIKFEEMLLKILLVSLTSLVILQVVDRFILKTGLSWSHDVIIINAAWFVIIGASYGVRCGCHISVDFFVKRAGEKVGRWLTLIAIFFVILYCIIFLIGSWVYIDKLYQFGIELDDIPVPKWLPMTVLIIGFSSLLIRMILMFIRLWKGENVSFINEHDKEISTSLFENVKGKE